MPFGSATLDMSDLASRHPYYLGIFQNEIERLLAEWVAELPVRVRYGSEVTGFAQDDACVDVHLSDGTSLSAAYLVGCDGGRSVVRKAAGIAFPGWEATRSNLIAEVQMTGEPAEGMRHDATGVHAMNRMADGTTVRMVVTEQHVESGAGPMLSDLRRELVRVYGTDFGVHSPTWISRFTDATRQAAAYRVGRVLLAGDAAHVHYPAGGQGLGLGVQDAVNLGWKLAQVVRGTSTADLLDTYEHERHPVVARTLRHTMALGAMQRRDDRQQALVDEVSELAGMDEPRRWLVALGSGLDIRYDLGDGHPLVGRRMPDLDLVTAGGTVRTFELLHDARPVLLDLGTPATVDVGGWADRVTRVEAHCAGPWELPVLGPVAAPTAVLIRPDGHVAWVDDGAGTGLAAALARWCGAPDAA